VVGRRLEVGARDYPLGHRIDAQIVDRGRDEDGARERLALDRMAIRVKAHFAVYAPRHAKRPPVDAFLSWLHGEAAANAALAPREKRS